MMEKYNQAEDFKAEIWKQTMNFWHQIYFKELARFDLENIQSDYKISQRGRFSTFNLCERGTEEL